MQGYKGSLLIVIVLIVMLGCAGRSSPTLPDTDPGTFQDLTSQPEENRQSAVQSQSQLWGYYDFHLDLESRSVEIVPNRSMMFALNVVQFLNLDPAGVSISNFSATPVTGSVNVELDITIKHPLDNEKFVGYDVRGILIGNGSYNLNGDPDLLVPVEGTDQWLSNYDGFTRWFNPTEFTTPGICGYTPGLLATSTFTGTGTVNQYKYFADGLDATSNVNDYLLGTGPSVGYFLHGTSNTRRYKINFPVPVPGITYGYAIVASWAGGDPMYHPAHCTEALATRCGTTSNAWYTSPTDNGGYIVLNARIFDWSSSLTGGVMENYQITIDSPIISAPYILNTDEMTPVSSIGQEHKYSVSVPADNLSGSGHFPIYLTVEYPFEDYTNPFGIPNSAGIDPLAFTDMIVYHVEPVELAMYVEVTMPNGGEEWIVQSQEIIQWDFAYGPGKVDIYYFKDDNPSNPITLASNVPNTGVYELDEVPFDVSDTVKVGVASVLFPALFDSSDGFFSILQPMIELTSPNGGEQWEALSDQEITWTSDNMSGTVSLSYSKDDFVSDINVIENNVTDSGSYLWEVPDDPFSTVKVRIKSDTYAIAEDISDFSFTIKEYLDGFAYTYGGSANLDDFGYAVAYDGQQNYYAVGEIRISGSWSFGAIVKFDVDGVDWVRGFYPVNTGTCVIRDIAITSSNDIYVVGEFNGTVDFDPDVTDTAYKTSIATDAFMARLDTDAGYFGSWTWGESASDSATSIVIDSGWNKYVTGYFTGTNVDFDPGSGTDNASAVGQQDIFINHFNSSDTQTWVRTWGGTGVENAGGIAESGGSIYVTGSFENTVDFDPDGTGDTENSEGFSDVFLCKRTSTGDFLWAHSWGGMDTDSGEDVTVDSSGNIYVTGIFADINVDFDPDPIDDDIRYADSDDVFLSKFDSTGDFLYVNTWGGDNMEGGRGLLYDPSGYIYVCGRAAGAAGNSDFDPTAGEDLYPSLSAFLSKFDLNGNYLWARTWGSYELPTQSAANGMARGINGSVHVVGTFHGTDVNFAPSVQCSVSPFNIDSTGGYDIFYTLYRADGCW